ncbi:fibronectin type III domain-containing protein 4-like isoform X2 [Phyllopteryx taeniolatus]|uniref:fibronectin type III domain-containing protein 4-like isoform X2 n=1 Tax=Phyllopteryx taeniolatus TaxID=161469 RepID=UPI002AD443FB|nr:fibronectin type III domain-containing protein 4-like isoform X2 [Phyllopteryx taeniolatus]
MRARSQEAMSAFPHLDTRLPLSQMMIMMMGCLMVGGTVPAAPVNVSVTQLRAHSAMVTWNVPLGDTVIGYAISQQRQDGLMQRSIREVNTSSRWCVLWDLDEDTHYSVQVQSVGLQGDSQPSRAIHFRTLERSDHYPAGVLDHHEPAMEGLGMSPHLQTGELLIITTVLLLWAAVIALFCRQYDIIKDSDSNGTREKAKRPLVPVASSYYNASPTSSPVYHNGAIHSGRLHRASSSISIIRV